VAKDNPIIFQVSGGLGRNIMATAVCRQIKRQHKKSPLHVMASYPDVFVDLPTVERVYPFPGGSSFLADFYDGHKDFDVMAAEPYVDLAYRKGEQHLVDVWCRRLGLQLPDDKRGELALHDATEREWARRNLHQLLSMANRPKLVAIQPWGGTSFYQAEAAMDPTRPKHTRDLPPQVAQDIVDGLRAKNVVVLQLSLPTEPQLRTVIPIPVQQGQIISPRYLFALLELCDGLVSIDSFAAHAWVALGKQGATVLWGGTDPTALGYSCNSNLTVTKPCPTPHCGRPDTYMFDTLGNGQPWRCPHKGACMNHSAETVVQSILGSLSCPESQK
jgi:hypothetical protein